MRRRRDGRSVDFGISPRDHRGWICHHKKPPGVKFHQKRTSGLGDYRSWAPSCGVSPRRYRPARSVTCAVSGPEKRGVSETLCTPGVALGGMFCRLYRGKALLSPHGRRGAPMGAPVTPRRAAPCPAARHHPPPVGGWAGHRRRWPGGPATTAGHPRRPPATRRPDSGELRPDTGELRPDSRAHRPASGEPRRA